MDTTLLSEFDSFLSEVSLKLNNKQLLEQENASLKTGKHMHRNIFSWFTDSIDHRDFKPK